MPQLHFSVDEKTAAALSIAAESRNISLSRYLAELVSALAVSQWPDGYLESVVGSCAQAPLTEPTDLELDDTSL